MANIKLIYGAGAFGSTDDPLTGFSTPEAVQSALNICRRHGCTTIDSARGYPPHAPHTAEPLLGQTDVASWATIDSKVDSFPGDHAADKIAASIDAMLRDLRVSSVNILFLHIPDRTVPFEETLRALDQAHKAGRFKELGLSNYEPEEILTILSLCRTHSLVAPTVYQGQYNALVRSLTTTVLPILRTHAIRLHAWSPAAGGLFSPSPYRPTTPSRLGQSMSTTYAGPRFATALADLHAAVAAASARDEVHGGAHEVVLRWLRWHGELDGDKGDAIVFGARSEDQLRATLRALVEGGPLGDELVAAVETCWESVKGEVPYFSPFGPLKGA